MIKKSVPSDDMLTAQLCNRLAKNVHCGPSMMAQGKTPWKNPEGSLQLLWVLSKAFHLERPSKAIKTPWGLSKGSFTVTSLTVHSVLL